jgi:hypothetical protein
VGVSNFGCRGQIVHIKLNLRVSWRLLFLSLYLRPKSTVSRHPKVGNGVEEGGVNPR